MTVFIITGEASGDLHASQIVSELIRIEPEIKIKGWGGNHMKESGAQITTHIDELNFMGFWEVVQHLPQILRLTNRCKRDIQEFRPDLILYVDFAGFNMRIAQWAKREGFTNYWYIAPKLWASRPKRIKQLRYSLDHLFCIFPFEEEYFQSRGIRTTYVGNPVEEQTANHHWQQPNGAKKRIALMPGSRPQEIKYHMPIFNELIQKRREYNYAIIKSAQLPKEVYYSYLDQYHHGQLELIDSDRYTTIAHSDLAIVASGTASLEVALIGTPQIVIYRTSLLNYWIGKRIIITKHISLPNIILKRAAIKELIQKEYNFDNIVKEIYNTGFDEYNNRFHQIKCDMQNLLGKKFVADIIAIQIIKAFKKS